MDEGLSLAVRRAGGIRALARKLQIRHQSILEWKTVPAARLLAVEAATGVPREKLRPELYAKRPTRVRR
jgi:DNA-binding transcriptional regulator YdaS (Cro superfamily)